jgi:HPt (histidine-containing phosphotransfer) domain-containing protein
MKISFPFQVCRFATKLVPKKSFPDRPSEPKLTVPEPAAGLLVFDVQGLMGRIKGNRDFLRHLFGVFQKQYPEQRKAMKEALLAGQFTSVRTTAHSLKGNLSNLGGQRAAAAAALVQNCETEDPQHFGRLCDQLDASVRQFQEALSTFLQ